MAIKREAHLMPDSRGSRRADGEGDVTSSANTLTQALEQAQGPLASVLVVASVLFRLLAYVFLRWIPSGQITRAIYALYVLYVFSWLGRQRKVRKALAKLVEAGQMYEARHDLRDIGRRVKSEADDEGEAHTNGDARTESIGNGSLENIKIESQNTSTSPSDTEDDFPAFRKPRHVHRVSTWSFMKAVAFGTTTRSPRLNRLVFAGHALLFLLFLDSYWSPYIFPSHLEHNLRFARVGALGPKSATVHVRYPWPLGYPEEHAGSNQAPEGPLKDVLRLLSNPQPVRVVYRETYISARVSSSRQAGDIAPPKPKRWERGPLLTLTPESDWTASARIDGLWPSTEYEWRLAFAHNATFTSMPAGTQRFTTWPDPRLSSTNTNIKAKFSGVFPEKRPPAPHNDPNHFAFATSSCIKPDFPYAPAQFWAWSWLLRLAGIGGQPGGIARRNRIPGFDKLAEAAVEGRQSPTLRFFLQLGDLIYADVPYYGGPITSAYRKLYRNLFASESFRRVYEKLPVIGIYDDHEVINNWGSERLVSEYEADDENHNAWRVRETQEIPAFRPATKAWQEYVGSSNPEPLEADENYYTFRYGDTAFFVMDTRKYRTPWQLPDDEDKTMLGAKQRDAFIRWLGAVNSTATFKFVISSVPFNSLWGGPLDFDGKRDSWAAYTSERETLLQVMQYVPNIIVLSGDRHEFASVGVAPQTARKDFHPVTEFSTGPLSMFYIPIRTLDQSHGLGSTGAERLYKYLPDGNVKWTEFEVDTRDSSQPRVFASVKIDGAEAWRVEIRGRPVRPPRNAIGDLAKSFLELLQWRPRRWF